MPHNHNNELKKLTKESLFTALMQLMESKHFDDISITELCRKAGVSRMAFYRNYQSKGDIIDQYFIETFTQETKDRKYREVVTIHEGNVTMVGLIYKHKDLFSLLVKFGSPQNLYQIFESFIGNFIKTYGYNKSIDASQHKLLIAYCAGGVYHMILEWVNSDYAQSADQIIMLADQLHFSNNKSLWK